MKHLFFFVAVISMASPALAFNIGMPPGVAVLETTITKFTSPGDIPAVVSAYKNASIEIDKHLGELSKRPDCVAPTMETWKVLGGLMNEAKFDQKQALTTLKKFQGQGEECRKVYYELGLDKS